MPTVASRLPRAPRGAASTTSARRLCFRGSRAARKTREGLAPMRVKRRVYCLLVPPSEEAQKACPIIRQGYEVFEVGQDGVLSIDPSPPTPLPQGERGVKQGVGVSPSPARKV